MMPRPIPPKVRGLIAMLGSDADHEALSAARALGRVLRRAGLAFTDLAAAIPAGEGHDNVTTLPLHPDPSHSPVPPFDPYAWRRVFTPRQEQDHRAHVRFCQNHSGRLTPWETGFVQSVARLHGNLSIKQGDRLAVIVDRISREARHG